MVWEQKGKGKEKRGDRQRRGEEGKGEKREEKNRGEERRKEGKREGRGEEERVHDRTGQENLIGELSYVVKGERHGSSRN